MVDSNEYPVSSVRACLNVAIVLWAMLAAGCGQKSVYPVRGQIVDAAGNPIAGLKGGAVEFESVDVKSSANGSIDEQGNFRLTTSSPGDGAHVGKQRVAITRPYFGPERPAPFVIDPKYEKFETSGLEAVVEPKENVIQFKVELFKGG
jgi:hypothetical protein